MCKVKFNQVRFEDNSWGAIRVLCCVLIMVSHYCIRVFGDRIIPYKPLLFAGSSLVVFFCLCGFLVGPSVMRNTKVEFFKKRIIRLYPVFLTTLITTVLVVFISGQNVKAVLIAKWFSREIALWGGQDLCGISNGAMWAIFIQIQFYVFSAFTYKWFHAIESKAMWFGLILLSLALNVFYVPLSDILDLMGMHILRGIYQNSLIPYYFFFLIGMFSYRFFDSIIPFLKKYAYVLLIIHVIWHMRFIKMPPTYCYIDPIMAITASMAAIGLAYRLPLIKLKNDLSYDIYCWHMPVITAFAVFCDIEGWIKVLLCISITLLLSFLTNKHIEQKLIVRKKHD